MDATITQVLAAVEELDTASATLAAWELCLHEDRVGGAWRQAIGAARIEAAAVVDGELHYRLTFSGKQSLAGGRGR